MLNSPEIASVMCPSLDCSNKKITESAYDRDPVALSKLVLKFMESYDFYDFLLCYWEV